MVCVFLAEGFEEIEALTVVDILRRAEIEVVTVSIGDDVVTGAHGIPVIADCTIEDVDEQNVKMFVLPGGMPGTTNLENSEKLQQLLKNAVDSGKWIAAICAAPLILGRKGYLEGKEAICYPGFEKYLKGAMIKDSNVNISGNFITSKGPGTAMDFAYAIVTNLKNEDVAHNLKKQMQYCR